MTTRAPRLSSVQKFVLKEILLDAASGASGRRYGRTREALFDKGLLSSTWCGALTTLGRSIAERELDADRTRRNAAKDLA